MEAWQVPSNRPSETVVLQEPVPQATGAPKGGLAHTPHPSGETLPSESRTRQQPRGGEFAALDLFECVPQRKHSRGLWVDSPSPGPPVHPTGTANRWASFLSQWTLEGHPQRG